MIGTKNRKELSFDVFLRDSTFFNNIDHPKFTYHFFTVGIIDNRINTEENFNFNMLIWIFTTYYMARYLLSESGLKKLQKRDSAKLIIININTIIIHYVEFLKVIGQEHIGATLYGYIRIIDLLFPVDKTTKKNELNQALVEGTKQKIFRFFTNIGITPTMFVNIIPERGYKNISDKCLEKYFIEYRRNSFNDDLIDVKLEIKKLISEYTNVAATQRILFFYCIYYIKYLKKTNPNIALYFKNKTGITPKTCKNVEDVSYFPAFFSAQRINIFSKTRFI